MIIIQKDKTIFEEAREILKELNVEYIDSSKYFYLDLKKRKFVYINNINCLVFEDYLNRSFRSALIELEKNFYFETLQPTLIKGVKFIRFEELLKYPIGLIQEPFQNIFNGDVNHHREPFDQYKIVSFNDPSKKFYKYLMTKDKISKDDLLVLCFLDKNTYGYFKLKKLIAKIDAEELKSIYAHNTSKMYVHINPILFGKLLKYLNL